MQGIEKLFMSLIKERVTCQAGSFVGFVVTVLLLLRFKLE